MRSIFRNENLNLKCYSLDTNRNWCCLLNFPFKMRKIHLVSSFPAMALPCVFLRTAQPPGWLARPRFLLATRRHIPPSSNAEASSKQMNCRHRLFLAIPRPACSTNRGGKPSKREGNKKSADPWCTPAGSTPILPVFNSHSPALFVLPADSISAAHRTRVLDLILGCVVDGGAPRSSSLPRV